VLVLCAWLCLMALVSADEKAAPVALSEVEVSQVAQAKAAFVATQQDFNAAYAAALDPASLKLCESGVLGRLQTAKARQDQANAQAQFIVMSAIARHKLDPDKIWNLSDDGKTLSEVPKK